MRLKNREAIVKLFTTFCVTEAPRLVILDSTGTVIRENARGGEGFGFGCDPLRAYEKLMEDLAKAEADRKEGFEGV